MGSSNNDLLKTAALGGLAATGLGAAGIGPLAGMFGAGAGAAGAGAAGLGAAEAAGLAGADMAAGLIPASELGAMGVSPLAMSDMGFTGANLLQGGASYLGNAASNAVNNNPMGALNMASKLTGGQQQRPQPPMVMPSPMPMGGVNQGPSASFSSLAPTGPSLMQPTNMSSRFRGLMG